jgi:hypothetical protein
LAHVRADLCAKALLGILEWLRTEQRPWAMCQCGADVRPDATSTYVFDGLYGSKAPPEPEDVYPCWRQSFVPFELASDHLRARRHPVMVNSAPAGKPWRPGKLLSLFCEWRRRDAMPYWVTASWIEDKPRAAVDIQGEGGDSVARIFLMTGIGHVPALARYESHRNDDLLIGDLLASGAVKFITSGEQGLAVALLPGDLVWERKIKDIVLFGWERCPYTHVKSTKWRPPLAAARRSCLTATATRRRASPTTLAWASTPLLLPFSTVAIAPTRACSSCGIPKNRWCSRLPRWWALTTCHPRKTSC